MPFEVHISEDRLVDLRQRGALLVYSGRVRRLDAGVIFDQEYVAVLLISRGRLTRFREYSNPLRVFEAVDGAS